MIGVLNDRRHGISAAAFSHDGQRIVSGSADNTLRLWDADTSQPIEQPLTGNKNHVSSVAYSPDGRRIVSGSEDATVRLWPAPPQTAWPEILCSKLTDNMSHAQWHDWVSPHIDYIRVVPGAAHRTHLITRSGFWRFCA